MEPASRLVNSVLGGLGPAPKAPRIAMAFAAWTLAADPEIAREAAERADRCVRGLSMKDVLWLERSRRDNHAPPDPRREAWKALRAADLTRFEAFADATRTSLLCLLTAHPNGHVRQASIERLSLVRDGVEVSFLLTRVNDWVRSVRAAAKLAVLARITEARKGALVRGRELLANLPLFDRLRDLGRDDHAPFYAAFEAMLAEPAFARALDEGMSSPRRDVRFRSFTKALERPEVDTRAVLSRALADRDASIRLWAARAAQKRLAGEELRAAVASMQRDGSAPVRNEATFLLATKIEPPDREALEHALLDPSATVRWTARHYLTERWKIDARAYYLQALDGQDPSLLAAALAGLAECSKETRDAAHALLLRDHPSGAVRKAALVALARWTGDKHVEELFAALGDERPSVAREATCWLKQHIDRVDPAWIDGLLRDAPRSHTRRMAVRLATYLDPKDAIGLLLEALRDEDEVVREEARRSIQPWVSRVDRGRLFFTPDERGRLQPALEVVRHRIGEQTADELLAILGRPPR